MNRRDFLWQATTGVAALGGGLYLMGGASPAEAAQTRDALDAWGAWRPESPVRLSESTRTLAQRALSGEHGRGMVRAEFRLDEMDTLGVTQDMRYALAAKLVAEKAPLRVLPGEKIIGSATLLEAPMHQSPVVGYGSVSHTTIGFDKGLKLGYRGLREKIQERLARGNVHKPESRPRTTEGRYGKAALTDGSGAFHWAARPLPEYAAAPMTVECRAMVRSKGHYNILAAHKDKSSPHHWELYTAHASGGFSVYLPGWSPAVHESAVDICDRTWHDLAMVHTEDAVRLYVDGTLVLENTVESAPGGMTGDGQGADTGLLWIGAYPSAGMGCDGAVEALRLSSGARAPFPVDWPLQADAATVGLWTAAVDERGDTVLRDASARGNDAQPTRNGGDLLESMLLCLDAAEIWRRRHLALLDERIAASVGEERETYARVRDTLLHVPENPPRSFHEAVQSLWFMYAFQRLMGNWSGIGRIDEMLGPYLEKDLAEGVLTMDEAREILAHFWVKGCEWIGAFETRGSGDAQHYQNIILSGVNAAGEDVTNAVTWLVLDIVEELHISDYPIAVRVNRNTPDQLFRRIAEVQRHGGGVVAIYNEDVAIEALVKFGYPVEEARCFANDGCWEMLIPGKTCFSYAPFDALSLLHETLGLMEPEKPAPDFPDFDSLYAAYTARLDRHLQGHHAMADGWCVGGASTPLLSIFVDDCIESTRGYYDRGAHYYALAPHAGGLANVGNSLLALKTLVYDQGRLTLPEFVAVLRADWEGHESLRRQIQTRIPCYGNDNDEADAMVRRVFDDYTDLAARVRERNGVLRPAGLSTFGREIEWAAPQGKRKASPDGHRVGAILATNFSPSPGTDAKGPTAVLRSYCKMDFTRTPNCATVELKMHPDTVRGEAGVTALAGLMRGFTDLGGMFLHIDVVDSELLLDAQRHPEKYPNLAVRIAGWSARFATLNKDWQDMVIARTQQRA